MLKCLIRCDRRMAGLDVPDSCRVRQDRLVCPAFGRRVAWLSTRPGRTSYPLWADTGLILLPTTGYVVFIPRRGAGGGHGRPVGGSVCQPTPQPLSWSRLRVWTPSRRRAGVGLIKTLPATKSLIDKRPGVVCGGACRYTESN